jgi:hypothetical protein
MVAGVLLRCGGLALDWDRGCSVNVMVNYTNRSGAEVNLQQLGQAYSLAVVSSCGVAIGASALIKRGPSFIKRLGFAVPYTAVVCAGAGNVILTRMPEIENGVPIRDLEGKTLGLSKLAAIESVKLTVLSRNVFLPMVPLVRCLIITVQRIVHSAYPLHW